jgi:membrane associated rhomboid family serine protease
MFMHGGFFHLAGNMVYLFLFGSCVEDLIGRTRYTIFYLLCGVVADYSQILVSRDHFASPIPSGGASGAISGAIGGFLLLLAKSQIDFKWVFFLFFRFWAGNVKFPAWLVISFWFLSDITDLLEVRLRAFEHGGVAFGAHVGGMAFGMGVIALAKPWLRRSGALDWIEEQNEEPTVGILTVRPEPKPTTAWHASDVRAQPRVAENAPVAAAVVPAENATIYLSWDGATYGPYALWQIQPMFKRGEIPIDASYWQQGMEEWRPAEELRDPGSG